MKSNSHFNKFNESNKFLIDIKKKLIGFSMIRQAV
jgi:hypothetical protein